MQFDSSWHRYWSKFATELQQNCPPFLTVFSSYLVKWNISQFVHDISSIRLKSHDNYGETHHSKCSKCLLLALRHALKQSRHWSIAWSMKMCWLLTTFQLDVISAHQRPSLVSDKHVPACWFQSVSPGTDALVWFSCSQRWKWMVQITILLWCLAAQTVAARHLSNCWRLLLSNSLRVRKSTELLRHKTPDFTPDVASQQTRPQSCRLQDMDSHPGMCLSKIARQVKHRW